MKPQFVIADLVGHLLNEVDRDPSVLPRFERFINARDVWRSLLFCILSSQVRVSVARRAANAILEDIPFFGQKLSSTDVYGQAKLVLQRKDIRYRFPEARAKYIANSWFTFAQVKDDFYGYLDSFPAEKDARIAIAERFPGLGFKQASMFLRDIGYSGRLCVIDTHILWYCAWMRSSPTGALTQKRYLELEDYLLESSDALGVAPNIFDTVIWAAVKALKSRQCSMQFA